MRGDRLLLAAGTTVLGMIGPVCAVAEEVDGGVGLIISGRVGRSVSAGAGVRIGVCVVARVVLGGGRFAPARGGCGLCCGGTGIIVTVGLLTGVLATGGDQGETVRTGRSNRGSMRSEATEFTGTAVAGSWSAGM